MARTRPLAEVSRRRFLQASGAVPLSVAAMGVGQSAAAASPLRRRGPAGDIFDPARPGRKLLANKYLTWPRTVMQSFVVDTEKDHVYVLQLVQANTSLPGDEEGDESYDRRAARGDMTLTKTTLSGERLGSMDLKFFGHGASMAMERDGEDLWFWTEIDSVPKPPGTDRQGRGSKLTRFTFEDGALLDAEHDESLWRRDLIPDSTQNVPNIDPVNNTLVLRYYDGDEFRLALYDLDEVKEEKSSYEPLYDISTPEVVASNVFQGVATFGEYVYLMDGLAYSEDNPAPPEGMGNAHLTRVSWQTGEVEQYELETTGVDHHRREPEGLHVAVTDRGDGRRPRVRLYTGFGTSAHENKDADRLCTIYYRDVIRR